MAAVEVVVLGCLLPRVCIFVSTWAGETVAVEEMII